LLTTLFPDQAEGFARRAAESRWGRLLGGVHCPSDVEAGRIVGEALAREMLGQPEVQKILVELRAEIAPFLLKKAG
jgi:acid phosphatase (class A)